MPGSAISLSLSWCRTDVRGNLAARVADDRWAVSTGQRKVRTPPDSMPRRTRGRPRMKIHGDGKCHRKSNRREFLPVRVKRRGKSPPPGEQSPGHEKPHAVQDKTGRPGRLARLAARPAAFRVIVASAPVRGRGVPLRRSERNDHHGPAARRDRTEFGLSPLASLSAAALPWQGSAAGTLQKATVATPAPTTVFPEQQAVPRCSRQARQGALFVFRPGAGGAGHADRWD